MESGFEKQEHRGPFCSVEPGSSSDRCLDRSTSPERERVLFRGLEDTGWSKLTAGLSDQDINLLSSACLVYVLPFMVAQSKEAVI